MTSRSDTMARLLRMARLSERCDGTGENAQEAIGHADAHSPGRRDFGKGVLAATTTAAAWALTSGAMAAPKGSRLTPIRPRLSGNVAIVGAGLAGLSCATELARVGIYTRVYEAADRVGGRCASLRGVFPGQVVERGGEFINSSHHTLIGYARELGLALEDYSTFPGSASYYFGGQKYSEAQVVEEYRAFASSIQEDLGALSYPTADRFSESDQLFDFMSLDEYLTLHGAGSLLRDVIGSAYLAEYGASIAELSSISFLRFIYGDKRSKQAPFGVGSGEYLRVADGNDRIATGLADRLSMPVELGHRLVAMRKLANGNIRLVFDAGGSTVETEHPAVVMTLPFSVLRDIELHASLGLPAWKRLAIKTTDMGDHSKLLVGFNQPYWRTRHGLNGTGFSDRADLQATWEANPSQSGDNRAVLVGHFGGARARSMTAATLQGDANAFLGQLEQAMPGANAAAVRDGAGQVLAYSSNWSSNPFSKGSHSCNRPGYFTTNAHNEGKAVDNLLFAGEHTSSFYEWQGFMEGAALSGLRAAGEVAAMADA
ncbi:MAG: amine oxidase [Lysobacteraceae bacterium]|nr:MAG: amine oxidase [Xanthomonadaceae bacterium]